MLLRKVFGPKKDVVCIQFGILSNQRLRELLCMILIPGGVYIMKSRRLWWARYVTSMGRQGMNTEVWWENFMENGHFEWQDNTAGFSICDVCVVSATRVYSISLIHHSLYCCLKPEVLCRVLYQFSMYFVVTAVCKHHFHCICLFIICTLDALDFYEICL
jgi:hypothetical protein